MNNADEREGNECKSVGDENEKGAADSGESQAKMSTVRVMECFWTES